MMIGEEYLSFDYIIRACMQEICVSEEDRSSDLMLTSDAEIVSSHT